jgi:hypothetical protein
MINFGCIIKCTLEEIRFFFFGGGVGKDFNTIIFKNDKMLVFLVLSNGFGLYFVVGDL